MGRIDMTGVILAGGKSRRMGEDKRFLTVGEATMLDRCCSVMGVIFSELLVIIAQDSAGLERGDCRVHRDLISDCGSLGGVYTGLTHAKHDRIFVVACDMPFLNPELVRFFVQRSPEADVVIGELTTGLQPLHAVYGKRAIPAFEAMAKARRLKIQSIVDESDLVVKVVLAGEWAHIDPLSRSFQNVNTPADLALARSEVPFSSLPK